MALNRLCAQLAFAAQARGVLLLDEDGDELARHGRCDLSEARTHISLARRAILIVLHDERTSAATVRQRVREARPRLERALDDRLAQRSDRL
ncbi:MAG TPA: hypothetical protein VFF06_21620 [Polyangia bacterium]|nr:hypothetical protein [Polyangia bacterium]